MSGYPIRTVIGGTAQPGLVVAALALALLFIDPRHHRAHDLGPPLFHVGQRDRGVDLLDIQLHCALPQLNRLDPADARPPPPAPVARMPSCAISISSMAICAC